MTKEPPVDRKTRELLRIMTKHNLSTRQVAELVGRSRQCVKRWTAELTVISKPMLDLLKYRLREDVRK